MMKPTELGIIIPGNTCIVHQQLDTSELLLRELLRQPLAFRLLAHVPDEDLDFAGPGVVFLNRILQSFFSSSSDVHLCSICHESLGDH